MEKGGGGETGNDGRREKIPFMIAGKINTSLSCYNISLGIVSKYISFSMTQHYFIQHSKKTETL